MKIFITGGTTGMGAQLALDYASEGHKVAVCGRDLSKVSDDFRLRIKCYELDVRHAATLAAAIRDFAVSGEGGRLDMVIANAGISISNKTTIPDFKRVREIIDINVHGVINTFEPALEIMLAQAPALDGQRGHLVAMGSVAGFNGLPKTSAYSASKAAVMKLCESFAIDLHGKGIAVTAIAPGFVDTPLTRINKHPMPFLLTANKASSLIRRAINKRKVVFIFPLRMLLLTYLMYYFPRGMYVKIMRLVAKFFYGKTE